MIASFLVLAATSAAPNLLLVTIDTLRADRLHAYGYARVETPATDRLAREGVLVEDAIVQIPQTRPSHVSILTGRLPYEHGIRDNYSPRLSEQYPTLASVLRQAGYDTGAFIGAFVLSAAGLDRGFQHFDDPFSKSAGAGGVREPERRGEEVVTSALAWLGRPRPRPFFAWVHLYDPHFPYEPPPPYARRYAGRPYDGEVAYSDAQVARLLDFLDRQGLRGRTLVVVTSDHGEGLGEHGEEGHLMFVYDATLRVPLLLSWPDVLPAGRRIAGQFRSIDLMPTLLELLGVSPVPTSGASRAASLKSGSRIPDNESYAESLFGALHFGYAPLRALRAEGWKYIEAPRPEVYNLREDPGETRNLVELGSPLASRMKERLRSHDAGAGAPTPVPAADAETMARLASLGYVGAVTAAKGGARGADPKDRVAEFQAFSRDTQEAITLYNRGELDRAIPILQRLSQGTTRSLEVEYFLGKSLLARKRYPEAARALERAVALSPAWSQAYADLSVAYFEMAERDKAATLLDRGKALDERNPVFDRTRGLQLQRLGDLAGAQAALERARSLDPGDATLRLMLSAVYRDQGRLDEALAEVRDAVRLQPASADVWNALGVLLLSTGQQEEAARAFAAVLERNRRDPDALFQLAELHLRAGRAQQALPLLERLVSVRPRYPGAAEALKEARSARASTPGSMRLRLIRVSERGQAEEIAQALAAGADFAALARRRSHDPSAASGGDLGLVRVTDLAEPLGSTARDLAPGQVSAVLETPSGYVLLKRER